MCAARLKVARKNGGGGGGGAHSRAVPQTATTARGVRWGIVEAREFLRWPGGGVGIPEDEPASITWPLGLADAVLRKAGGGAQPASGHAASPHSSVSSRASSNASGADNDAHGSEWEVVRLPPIPLLHRIESRGAKKSALRRSTTSSVDVTSTPAPSTTTPATASSVSAERGAGDVHTQLHPSKALLHAMHGTHAVLSGGAGHHHVHDFQQDGLVPVAHMHKPDASVLSDVPRVHPLAATASDDSADVTSTAEESPCAQAGSSAGASAAAASVRSGSSTAVGGVGSEHSRLPGVVLLGTVDEVVRRKSAFDNARRLRQQEELRQAKKKRLGGGSSGSATTNFMMSALAAGMVVPLFHPLSVEQRKALFEADLFPAFTSMAALTAENEIVAAEMREIVAGRRESKIGCRCASLSLPDVQPMALKKLRAYLQLLGEPTEGNRKALQLRLLTATRNRTGCMKLSHMHGSSGEETSGNPALLVDPHAVCYVSRHLEAHQPLAECHKSALALAADEAREAATFFAGVAAGTITPLPGVPLTGGKTAASAAVQVDDGSKPATEGGAATVDDAAAASTAVVTLPGVDASALTPTAVSMAPFIVDMHPETCPCVVSGEGCYWGACACCQSCCSNRPFAGPASAIVDAEAPLYRSAIMFLLSNHSGARPRMYVMEKEVVETWAEVRAASMEADSDDMDSDDSDESDDDGNFAAAAHMLASGEMMSDDSDEDEDEDEEEGGHMHVHGPGCHHGDSSDEEESEDEDEKVARPRHKKQREVTSDDELDAIMNEKYAATAAQAPKQKAAGKKSGNAAAAASAEPVSSESVGRKRSRQAAGLPPPGEGVSARVLVDGTGDKTPGPTVQHAEPPPLMKL